MGYDNPCLTFNAQGFISEQKSWDYGPTSGWPGGRSTLGHGYPMLISNAQGVYNWEKGFKIGYELHEIWCCKDLVF